MITLRLHQGTSLGARVVRGWTDSRWGHCDLVFGTERLVLDVTPTHGVRVCSVDQVEVQGAVQEIPCLYSREHEALEACGAMIGAPYDWWGAAAAGLPLLARQHPRGWFCSEACCHVLQAALCLPRSLTAWRQTPESLGELAGCLYPDTL